MGFLWFIYPYIALKFTEYGVTNKRVVFKKGIIGRQTEEMKLDAIETIEIQQGIWGRILGYGTVEITGRGGATVIFSNIDNPVQVKKSIEDVAPH